ncbi:type II secretion system F family protein [Vibrio mediterranei]|uniref:type II secretion system F family protein n=1 Tax=Vibrio mediterranei TaxID=689 RepID=UPI001EFC6D17|nr:type II secretion system F family protein [Vibrio mediterranei]MCG9626341.1 type II secretion system F family protein [Vibrio mediterranei]
MPNPLPMPLRKFRWRGVDRSGAKAKGQILALTEMEVRNQLGRQQIHIRKISRHRISFWTRLTHKISRKDITLFTRQLATLLTTRVPLVQALKLISESHSKAEMKSVLNQVASRVESGVPIAQALQALSTHFDRFYIDMIATGESSGNIAVTLDRLATYREKHDALQSKVVKAMIYPSMVLIVSCAVTYLMLTSVIPEFESMFKGFNANLPWFTSRVLELSNWSQSYGLVSVASLGLLIASIKFISLKNATAELYISKLAIKLPVVGDIITKATIAKFSRTLATSFSSGIPILTGIQASARTTENAYFQQAIFSIHTHVVAGVPVHLAMRNSLAFPEMVLQMVMIGEETGKLDEMLNKIASIYEADVDNIVDNLGTIIEPLVIVFLGTIIGGLVIAMYLPIFNLMSVIG